MDYINRYIYAVLKSLPNEGKDEVEKELRSNIDDMLMDDYSDANVESVLRQLGKPNRLADEYRKTKRSLIPSHLYSEYIHTLKIGALIYVGLALVLQLIVLADASLYDSIADMIISIVIAMSGEALTAFAAVFLGITVSFAVIARLQEGKEIIEQTKWSLKDLAPIPSTKTISVAEVVFEMMIVSALVYVLCFRADMISLSISVNHLTVKESFFSNSIRLYMPAFLSLFVIELGLSIFKLKCGAWNKTLAWVNCLRNVIATCIMLAFFLNPDIYNPAFAEQLSSIFSSQGAFMANVIRHTPAIAAAIALIDGIADSYMGFRGAKGNPKAVK